MSTDSVTLGWGYIGKIPTKGDFIKHGLAKSCSNVLHDWQQAVMAVSREQLQQRWQDLYLNAPIWHFALDAAISGESTLIGSMIPSVDAAGRYFFFTVARAVEAPAVAYWQQRAWSEDSQTLALAVLEDGFVFEEWQHRLSTMEENIAVSRQFNGEVALKHPHSESLLLAEYTPTDADSLLRMLLNEKFDKPCFWWTDGNDNMEPMAFICDGMPSIGKYAAMLDGEWAKWNW